MKRTRLTLLPGNDGLFLKQKTKKEKTLAQDLNGKGPIFFLLFVTLKGFSPQCMAVHICFQLFMLVGV